MPPDRTPRPHRPGPQKPRPESAPTPRPPRSRRVKPVVPAEKSLIESHDESTLPDLKPVGE
ncbi:MAG: hypothetical protein REI09_09360 [Candidatus Dactylopiibacterium sp.]|nr:hypothetical protein [Candidatus Dactylopiibacterium sp.]